jgi:hypothetical protein
MKPKAAFRRNFIVETYIRRRHLMHWLHNGRYLPAPSEVKQLSVLYHGLFGDFQVLVETGTYLGDMVWAQKDYFERIYSIELSKELYTQARERFSSVSNVHLLHGDSSVRLRDVIRELDRPALFWLDGHYSGGITAKGDKSCPIFAELTDIFASPFENRILIDDARLFNGTDDYPTLAELSHFIQERSNYRIEAENDTIILRLESALRK